MSSGTGFLPTDEASKGGPKGDGKGPSTDVIRQLLREQQKECRELHANSLFREFREGQGRQKRFGKGYVVQDTSQQPMFDDFQAEGQSRMFELIKQIAVKEEKPLRGVWASFGRPYKCLGDPTEPSNSLPKLYRDELANQDGNKYGRVGARKVRQAQGPADSQRLSASASRKKSATDLTKEEKEELKLTRSKNTMKFANPDREEAKFPTQPLRNANQRLTKSMAQHGAWISEQDADNEISDPLAAYGQPSIPKKHLAPLRKSQAREDDDAKSQVFITQGMGSNPADDMGPNSDWGANPARRMSYGGGRQSMNGGAFHLRASTADAASMSYMEAGGSQAGPEASSQGERTGPGHFTPLVEPAVPTPGEHDNPVYGWHNKFVEVRHKGRAALQAALWERTEGRYRARTVPPMAANLSTLLMADLDTLQGRKVPYASIGNKPASPFLKMEATWAAQEESRKVRTRQAQTLDPEELRVLQRFYDQLCALVEAQRMSDPLSLMVVHKVKSLLESGTFLQRTMLTSVMEHISSFCKGCGLQVRYNRFLLSVLTFISKCVGVSEVDFENLVTQYDLPMVVYGTPTVPSRTPPEGEGAQLGGTMRRRAKGQPKGEKGQQQPAQAGQQQQAGSSGGAAAAAAAASGGGSAEGTGTGEEGQGGAAAAAAGSTSDGAPQGAGGEGGGSNQGSPSGAES